MARPDKKGYVVYRGRTPGIYRTWEQCNPQVHGFSKAKFQGFESFSEAEAHWAEWQRKTVTKIASATPAPGNTARMWAQSVHSPTAWIEPSIPQQAQNSVKDASRGWDGTSSDPSQPSSSQPLFYYDPPLPQTRVHVAAASYTPYTPLPFKLQPNAVDLTKSSSRPLPQFQPSPKRPSTFIDLTEEDENQSPAAKRFKIEHDAEAQLERSELSRLEREIVVVSAEEKKVELSDEQQRVVNMAMRKNNIFLTGAAGSGKTVTLKEILRRLKMKKNGNKVQVIAPTGIAALPLGGKTTYSFAGWNQDSFREGIVDLLKKRRIGTNERIKDVDVLIIEEISMVESQFLERLNLLLQSVMGNTLPFGGKQVIFLGDFHQLPPVKPFARCLQCGADIPANSKEPNCTAKGCKLPEGAEGLTWSSKWAFKASVWKELKLRHVKLEQIHRQKDSHFQDVLNKIRSGTELTVEEWHHLECPKNLPRNAFAIRLMSRLFEVKKFNEHELANLRCTPKAWRAKDDCMKLVKDKDGFHDIGASYKRKEYTDSLRDHRFLEDLTLKIGARVVLLYNLTPTLVNGSQGVIVGYRPAELAEELERIDPSGNHPSFRKDCMIAYKQTNNEMRPLVRFADGTDHLIPAISSASLRGGAQLHEQYVVCRTQIPLTLAWALSIHKSQGMTLEYVEVSSRDIFEPGQLYVALSRATHADGLTVTGFQRTLLPMDKDVLEFYTKTKWEKLQGRPLKGRGGKKS
ncbi:ATP-dependent DNA helicase [Lachnellula occidentalis]|uniref:ATP-dependent DNA helicase n=1 Tax=Lachnellula occidentalis TaxID=215460 RepID=A0A8H8UA80_9HELO|nr:ATP-dependent DNA helicase [Lachnellula occidentalis]